MVRRVEEARVIRLHHFAGLVQLADAPTSPRTPLRHLLERRVPPLSSATSALHASRHTSPIKLPRLLSPVRTLREQKMRGWSMWDGC